ncbi:hypothetical protein FC50_GL001864 [Lacticaseibacillus pantheris DSM 15945 = JCM 12539 = NBRC 106106]|uniref:Uncharacterized protein n=2 Tax=Lacticaseibacillus pantheris TaxID=171523 RepID=A0A0R1TWB3_9LACO|nr:hypothetical protein FC50_GL001864 [Lacticaseibacillus pantheris DSM 15945 = JCM 12539 = NBRC 106106]
MKAAIDMAKTAGKDAKTVEDTADVIGKALNCKPMKDRPSIQMENRMRASLNVEYIMSIMKLLVERGINLNGQDKDGAVPIKYLVTNNALPLYENDGIYKCLLEHGASPHLRDNFGKSPVDYANKLKFRSDFIDVVKEYEANEN